MSIASLARRVALDRGADDLAGLLERHPAVVTLAMLGGLALSLALAWILPEGAGGPVFVLGLMVFAAGWAFLLALHLEETFGAFVEVNRLLVTGCYLAALVLLPLALMVIELLTGLGWSLLFLCAWGGGCLALGYLLWTATRALVFIEERRWVAPEQRVPTFLMMFVLPVTIPYLQYRLRTALREAREDEWTAE
jgi:hypothetical protein